MIRRLTFSAIGLAALACLVLSLGGQEAKTGKGMSKFGKDNKGKREEPEQPKARPLPDDKRLLALHLDFVKQAEKLGKEYEADKEWSKARAVYEEILKLVPQYPPAQAKLAEMLGHERSAQATTFAVQANAGWQDTGIDLLPNKPVSIVATGKWTFHLQVETNAEGLTIPKELRDFNPGCLIGMIPDPMDPENNKPFVVGPQKQLMPERGGRLFLRMYDTDPRDNDGELTVEVRGTFKEPK
jgi:hypothetical protein